jgi:hypothetical protein
MFSLSYFEDLLGPVGGDTEMSLKLGDELPTKMRYSLADGGVNVSVMVAPRIDDR